MCFSASASFGVSVVLSGFGIATLKKVQDPRQYPFAGIPFIFAIQQFIEGFVWLSLTNPGFEHLQAITPYAYLIFAQAVWPILVPLSIMLLEPDRTRKRMLAVITFGGTLVAATLLYYVFTLHASAEIRDYNIHYNLGVPTMLSYFTSALYVLATVAAPFISSVKHMRWLGWSSLSSLLVSLLYFEQNLVSVWCFFAAVISVVVWVIITEMQPSKVKVLVLPVR